MTPEERARLREKATGILSWEDMGKLADSIPALLDALDVAEARAERAAAALSVTRYDSDWCPLCKQGWDCAKTDQQSRAQLARLQPVVEAARDALQSVTDAGAVEEYHTPTCSEAEWADPDHCVACVVRDALSRIRALDAEPMKTGGRMNPDVTIEDLQRLCDHYQAENARLREERDRAEAERDLAANRLGWRKGELVEDRIDELEAERVELQQRSRLRAWEAETLRAQLARLQPVVEAARKWANARGDDNDTWVALLAAIRALDAEPKREGGT